MSEWKAAADRLFFEDKLNITQIADILDISRKSVSKYLSSREGYDEERENRKKINIEKRKEYKREWDRRNRNTLSNRITADELKREHETAVKILSAEKYY